MAKSELFPRMPRVDYEPLDRRLRLTPEYYGKHTVVLGCLDVDGHGYLNPDTDARDYAKKFVKPGTALKFSELTRALDLQQMSRLFKPNTNVGGTDEITPAMAELQEQGATNISFMRLDMAFVEDKLTSKMHAVLQSTGLPPEEWITRMGFIKGSGGAWTAKAKLDPLTDYIPSKAYRAFVAQQLGGDVIVAGQSYTGEIGGTTIDFTTEQAYKDPSDADMRYHAIGKALNNLIGEDFDLLVLGTSPAWMNPAKTWKNTGAYPARTGDEVDAGEVIEAGAPTINNPNLSKIVLNPVDYSFSSFDAIGYDQATITLGAPASIHVGDELAISVGGYAITVKAVDAGVEPNYAQGEFRVGGSLTAGQIGEELEDAIMLWTKDIGEETLRSPVHAVGVDNVVNLTSLIPGEEGRIAIHVLTTGATGFTVASTKSTAVFKVLDNTLVVTTAGSETSLGVTSSGQTVTVKAAATQDSATGKFAKGADPAGTAANVAAALNGFGAGKVIAFAIGVQVLVTPVKGGDNFKLTGTSSTVTAISFTAGGNGADDTVAIPLIGSHYLAAERSFAHLLGNFCFWQSYYESAIKGFIGTEPWDTDLDGKVTAEDLRAVIGRERFNVEQYIDDAEGTLFDDNGAGLLGFENMKGFDGIHRRQSNSDLPVNYKFFATGLGMYMIQEGMQENVVMFTGTLSDVLLTDSDKGEYFDLGARLRVACGDVFVYNPVAKRYDEQRGGYVTSGAISMAGLDAIRPMGRSLTNLRLRNVVPIRRLSQTHLDKLLKARLIPFKIDEVSGQAVITADDTGAFNIDEFHRSDFVMGLSLDVLDACVEDIRAIGKPMIGRGMSPQLIEHFTTEAEYALKQRIEMGHIKDFRFRFLSTPAMQVLGEAEFFLEVEPCFEWRKLRIKAGLTMPTNAMTASAGTF